MEKATQAALKDDEYNEAERIVRAICGMPEMPGDRTGQTGAAMDSRTMAFDMSATHPGRIVADRERAIAEVERIVGRHTVMACDSAASVFGAALKHMGVSTSGIHASALPNVFRAHAAARHTGVTGQSLAAHGRAVSGQRNNPDIARIKVL